MKKILYIALVALFAACTPPAVEEDKLFLTEVRYGRKRKYHNDQALPFLHGTNKYSCQKMQILRRDH